MILTVNAENKVKKNSTFHNPETFNLHRAIGAVEINYTAGL